jgi:hypothetical protein
MDVVCDEIVASFLCGFFFAWLIVTCTTAMATGEQGTEG